MDDARRLLLDIASCERLVDARAGGNECADIVCSQRTEGLSGFHVPEPWNGDLESAPLLFLASNPSIGEDELFPTWDPRWTDDEVARFFQARFGEDPDSPISVSTFRSLDRDGAGRLRPIKHLANVQRIAQALYDSFAPVPGRDYAVAEIVHCKSRGEQGVANAKGACTGKYLGRMLDLSGARVVVVLGGSARDMVVRHLGIQRPGWNEVVAAGESAGAGRLYLFTKHPSAWGTKIPLAESLSSGHLADLRSALVGVL